MTEIRAQSGDVLVLAGTMKGAFLFHSGPDRDKFEVTGPHFPGHVVYALAFDGRAGRRRVLAGVSSAHWGAVVRASDDFGASWSDPAEGNLRFPADTDTALANVWQLRPAGPQAPDTVFAGVEPAALFRSDDAGSTFELVRGLWDHPHREHWTPGGGGKAIHSIVPHPTDPARLTVAMSTGGVYVTEDGGETWAPRNHGIRAVHVPDPYPEYGHCVHKIAQHPDRPERFYAQVHHGVYRSDDDAVTWQSIAEGLPSDFGFPMVVHPHRPDVVYNFPLVADARRFAPDGRCAVYRSEDAGTSWDALTDGLPDPFWNAVMRDAMCVDAADRAGIYFGTRAGSVYGSRDDGEHWRPVVQNLPDVLSVRAVVA